MRDQIIVGVAVVVIAALVLYVARVLSKFATKLFERLDEIAELPAEMREFRADFTVALADHETRIVRLERRTP